MSPGTGTGGAPLNVAVVGFGKLGLLHAGLVNGLPGSRLAAVVESSDTVRQVLGALMPGVAMHPDHQSLIRGGGIDAAFIATPTEMHVPIATDLVDSGIPVFIEKPLSPDAGQARPLLEALRKRGLPNMVGYMGRMSDTFLKARDLVASGALGRLQMLRSSMYVAQLFRTGKGWRYEKARSGGGVLITQNAHIIDLLLWMFGPIEYVSGQVGSLYSESVEDRAHAWFQFRSGLSGFMDASWSSRHFRSPTIAIHVQGSQGTLDVDDDSVRLFLDKGQGELPAGWSHWRKPDLYRPVPLEIGGTHYTRQAMAFLNHVRGERNGEGYSSTVESAWRTQCVIDAIYQSATQRGAAVNVAEALT
jgi:predicted dehydrogenase